MKKILNEVRRAMEDLHHRPSTYGRLLTELAERTKAESRHILLTTNWDYLLQRDLEQYILENCPGILPKFLANSHVFHLNGSIEPGEFPHRPPLLLETDAAQFRRAAFEVNQGFAHLLWSSLLVVVGLSFECSIDRGLLAALQAHEDNLPIGSAEFVVVEPCSARLESTVERIRSSFPRSRTVSVGLGLAEWIESGMQELSPLVLDPK